MNMKAKIKAMLEEDRGVSPVIGVILMVAITVILAAVIGTFVLGLGDSLNQAPQAQLDVSSTSTDNITISHNGGDSIPESDLEVRFDSDAVALDNGTGISDGDEFSVGSSVTFNGTAAGEGNFASGDEVRVRIIHKPSESILLDSTVDVE